MKNKPLLSPNLLINLKCQKYACEYLRLALRKQKGIEDGVHREKIKVALHKIAEAQGIHL